MMRIEAIAELLDELGGSASIRPEAGAFHSRVIDGMAKELDDLCEDLEETAFDVEIEITSDPVPRNIAFSLRASSADFDTTIHLYAYQLNSRELHTILQELAAVRRKLEVPREVSKPKVIVRKRHDNSYDLHVAAQKLDVGSEWLKKTVPCTGYKCEDRDDGKKSLDLRYSTEMIDTLCKLRDNPLDAADLKRIADLCCEGDIDWARDIMSSLKSRRQQGPHP